MFTPGIGPATAGLSGFALFIDSQPATASRSGDNTSRMLNFVDMVRLSSSRTGGGGIRTGARLCYRVIDAGTCGL
jgi:hypothetical protein